MQKRLRDAEESRLRDERAAKKIKPEERTEMEETEYWALLNDALVEQRRDPVYHLITVQSMRFIRHYMNTLPKMVYDCFGYDYFRRSFRGLPAVERNKTSYIKLEDLNELNRVVASEDMIQIHAFLFFAFIKIPKFQQFFFLGNPEQGIPPPALWDRNRFEEFLKNHVGPAVERLLKDSHDARQREEKSALADMVTQCRHLFFTMYYNEIPTQVRSDTLCVLFTGPLSRQPSSSSTTREEASQNEAKAAPGNGSAGSSSTQSAAPSQSLPASHRTEYSREPEVQLHSMDPSSQFQEEMQRAQQWCLFIQHIRAYEDDMQRQAIEQRKRVESGMNSKRASGTPSHSTKQSTTAPEQLHQPIKVASETSDTEEKVYFN